MTVAWSFLGRGERFPAWGARVFAVLVAWSPGACIKEGPVLLSDATSTSSDLSSSSSTLPTGDGEASSLSLEGDAYGTSELDSGRSTATVGSEVEGTTDTISTSMEPTSPEESSDGAIASTESGFESGSESTGADECVVTQGGDGESLVDDLEDGDTLIPKQDGRDGWWYTWVDGTGGEFMPAGAWAPTDVDAFAGQFSARISGSGFLDWGATLGVTLNRECPYDGSAFSGIEFWARGVGRTRVRFTTMATVPNGLSPGTCEGVCWDDFGTFIDLTQTWTRYTVAWGDLSQEGWGEPAEFDPLGLLAIVWQAGMSGTEFDVWVDDIRFLGPE